MGLFAPDFYRSFIAGFAVTALALWANMEGLAGVL